MSGVIGHMIRKSACLAVIACGPAAMALGQTANPQSQLAQPQPKDTSLNPDINHRLPDANQVMKMREQQAKRKNFDAANTERKRQLAEDSALLLKLAEELKAEIGVIPTEALSETQMRKLEDIERLAHNVQHKMKLTMGAS